MDYSELRISTGMVSSLFIWPHTTVWIDVGNWFHDCLALISKGQDLLRGFRGGVEGFGPTLHPHRKTSKVVIRIILSID